MVGTLQVGAPALIFPELHELAKQRDDLDRIITQGMNDRLTEQWSLLRNLFPEFTAYRGDVDSEYNDEGGYDDIYSTEVDNVIINGSMLEDSDQVPVPTFLYHLVSDLLQEADELSADETMNFIRRVDFFESDEAVELSELGKLLNNLEDQTNLWNWIARYQLDPEETLGALRPLSVSARL